MLKDVDAAAIVQKDGEDDGEVPYLRADEPVILWLARMGTYLMTVSYEIKLAGEPPFREMRCVKHQAKHVGRTGRQDWACHTVNTLSCTQVGLLTREMKHLPCAVLQRQMRQRRTRRKADPEEEQDPPWLHSTSATRKPRETRNAPCSPAC